MSNIRRRVMGSSEPDIEPVNGFDYVDLGLPSGLLWAKCNVGANSETEYGNYYQYGKGNRTYQETSGETVYGGMEDPLDSSVDTATQVMGSEWRMPTVADFRELIDNTDYTWATINGVNGGKFTSKTRPNAYVFFPAVGYYDSGSLSSVGSRGNVWSSTPSNSNTSNYLFFDSNGCSLNASYRRRGFSVCGVTSTPPTKVIFKVRTTDGTTTEGVRLIISNQSKSYTVETDATGRVALAGLDGAYLINSATHDLNVSSFTVNGDMTVNISATKRTDYVDLGLTSRTLWATCNIGANAPEEYGLYFSWGNVDGHTGGSYDFSAANYNGTSGKAWSSDIQPDSGRDAARVNLGSPWRMPTKEDYQELYDETDSEWIGNYDNTGVAGIKFMKKSDHSVFVFFPASGRYNGTTLQFSGTNGLYWSASFNSSTHAYYMDSSTSSVNPQNHDARRLGYAVRPVI